MKLLDAIKDHVKKEKKNPKSGLGNPSTAENCLLQLPVSYKLKERVLVDILTSTKLEKMKYAPRVQVVQLWEIGGEGGGP